MTAWSILWRGAVLLAICFAIVPPRTASLGPDPHPSGDYADAMARARHQQAVDDTAAAPGGGTILLSHGGRTPRAFVLLHGLSDSPRQFLPLASELYAKGDNVYVPRLPLHALRVGDARALDHLTAEQLRGCSDSAVDVAVGLGDSVIVVGLSAGGTMAAWLGQHRRDVGRVIMIAPALEFAKVPSVVEERMVDLALRAPGVTHRNAPDTSNPARDPGFDTRAIAQVFRLGVAVRKAAAHERAAAAEAVFVLNVHDGTIKSATALDLAHHWQTNGMSVQAYEFPDSLRLPHDVVDEALRTGRQEVVLPILVALARGTTLPSWLRAVAPVPAVDTIGRIGPRRPEATPAYSPPDR